MQRNTEIRRAVRQTLVMSAVATAATLPAQAQEAEEVDTIVVTGSRIRTANLEGTSPVTQVTSEDIATAGVTRVEDLITQLPQAFAAQNSTVANGATGAATVSLRNLGAARTLVLIDGRRMPYGSVFDSAADLNQIPSAMVERVEVLTGGASAVYGSDAVAGVVNFIMKKDFEGVQLDAQYGFYQHNNDFSGPGAVKLRDEIRNRGESNPSQFQLPDSNVTDGESIEVSLLVGASTEDGRGNVTAYATVRDNEEVLQRDRDYSACSLLPSVGVYYDPIEIFDSYSCGGSSTAFPARFATFGINDNSNDGPDGIEGTPDDVPDTNPLPDFSLIPDGNQFRGFTGDDLYNYGPTNHYQRPDTRYSIGAMGHYELAEYADVYTQLMFNDYESTAQIAPGGEFIGEQLFQINCDNAMASASQLADMGCGVFADPDPTIPGDQSTVPTFIGRRNVEGGGRQDTFHNTGFRGVVGLRGAISDNWDYDASAQYSKGNFSGRTLNRFVLLRSQRAVDAITDPRDGSVVCRSAINSFVDHDNNPDTPAVPTGGTLDVAGLGDANCVPYNIFDSNNPPSAASLAYLQAPTISSARIDQEIYNGTVTGDLGGIGLQSPFAAESIKVALGIERRTDRVEFVPDQLLQTQAIGGQGGPVTPLNGSAKVTDYFGELRVPLVQDAPFADQLSVDFAYRYSDYDSLTTDTYKIGMDWAPIEDIRFRGSFQRAVRAANVIELFTVQGFNLFDGSSTTDPCGPARTATLQQCLDTGVPAPNYGGNALVSPAGQYNFLQGGNPDLVPEESDTYTYGVILQPRFLPKLAMSIDYFDIEITDAVSTFGPVNALEACYQNNDPLACANIQRDALTGALWIGDGHVVDLNINTGGFQTKGIDVNLTYAGVELGRFGSLNFNLTGTYLDELIEDPGGGFAPYDCAGIYSGECDTPNPQWRHHFRIGWESPWNVDASLTWRYYDSVQLFPSFVESQQQLDYELGEQQYFDLAAEWQVTEKASLLLGINNVLDDDPPITSFPGTTGNGNTYPQTYDALGRWIFLRGSIGF
jgi:outer membrane receptor protein involved in Fe transport